MESNKITDLVRETKRSKATTLNLSLKELTSLPLEIFELKDITKLYIHNNQLTSLPPEISELKKLTELYISGNQLTSLPSEISELKNLTKLYISFNELTSLPSGISELEKLTLLDVSFNQLTSLPLEISGLKNLTELYIHNNQLTFLPLEISGLKNLAELYIHNNQLTFLSPEISELKNLTKLYLGNNQLTSLPPEITKLENLTELYLSGNQLVCLPAGISELKSLTKFSISRNQLTSLSPEILELNLEIEWEEGWKSNIIYLPDNPFENPPVEILKQGKKAVINYFKTLGEEKELLNDIKVLVVGNGGAGKTSLVKRLLGEGFNENEHQTQGINIKKLNIKNGRREIKANFWDFGGQEIMHATHQFFLSRRSLYILVLDGRRDENPEYWLKLIENFGGDSPVLVVINKIDQNPAFELNRKFLQEKYPSIKDFYRLSCKSNEGVEEFSKALKEEIAKVKHLEIKWPKSWFNVKSKLEKIRPNNLLNIEGEEYCKYCSFIEYNEYKRICDEEGIKGESEQSTLVDLLHDLGVILHFKDIPLLNMHVLEPEWVTNAVYKIVNSREIAESRGLLKLDMLPKILRQSNEGDFYYPPDQYGFIVSLMRKFELSYDLDDRTVLLPSLLEIQEPNFEFNHKNALRFLIDYDFLPTSVIPRFIVKMNRDIKDNLCWRTGVILENKGFNSTALVRSDNEAKRISIFVTGEQKRDYFSAILQRFREINNSFENLKATEKIPLPDRPEVTLSYKHLINLEMRGIETYMPDGSDNEYRVSDLLGTVINSKSGRASVEEILKVASTNRNSEKEVLETLRILQKIETESDTDESLLEKLNNVVSINIPLFGASMDLNEIVRLYLRWRKRQS